MKKILSLVSVLFLVLIPAFSVYAETTAINDEFAIDRHTFENFVGYKYDKFEKEWRYEGEYQKIYRNGFFDFGLVIEGDDTDVSCWSYVVYYSGDEYKKINQVSILVDESIFTYSDLSIDEAGYSTVNFGNLGVEMIKALSTSNEVAFKVFYPGYSSITEVTDFSETFSEIITWAKNVTDLASDYFETQAITLDFWDSYHNAVKD